MPLSSTPIGNWQVQMVDMIRGAAPLCGKAFAGGPTLTPLDQIGIYADQYRKRLGDALIDEIPGLVALLGQSEAHRVAMAYLADCPSTSWTLNRVARALPAWLEYTGAPLEQVEMATLDAAVCAAFEAADPVLFDPTTASEDPILVLQPPVQRLTVTHNVHEIRSAAHTDAPSPLLKQGAWDLVVFRPRHKVRHVVLPEGAKPLIDAFAVPTRVRDALTLAMQAGVDPAILSQNLGAWFKTFAEGRIVGPAST